MIPKKKARKIEMLPEIKRMWLEGLPASHIGTALGMTRNAVLGYTRRYLSGYRNGEPVNSVPRIVQKDTPWKERLRQFVKLAGEENRFTSEPVCVVTEPEPELLRVPLLETAYGQCRWIGDQDDKCCGQKIFRKSYCKHHYQRCYVEIEDGND